MKHLLVCTLGASWQVIPEIYAFLAPQVLDLYRLHPQLDELRQRREAAELHGPDEIWIVTTGGAKTRQAIQSLREWQRLLEGVPALRIWIAAETDQLQSSDECLVLRELTFRVVLTAVDSVGADGTVTLSLAGGRKTMSADLQEAGSLFGAHTWLHVIGPEPLPAELTHQATPALFAEALPQHLAGSVTPLIVGRGVRAEWLDPALELDSSRITREDFPLAWDQDEHLWHMPHGPTLTNAIERRRKAGGSLIANFFSREGSKDKYETWRCLQRLAPSIVQQLRQTTLSEAHKPWLTALPKADLHRHLGGCLSVVQQHVVAEAVWSATPQDRRASALTKAKALLNSDIPWPLDWPSTLRSQCSDLLERAEASSALLLYADPTDLGHALYGMTEPRLALKTTHPLGFAAYERPGELTGSAILGHPAALGAYAEAVVSSAIAAGLAYLELRGSPHKYAPEDPIGFLCQLELALKAATRRGGDRAPFVGFIWIIDRRQRSTIARTVALACKANSILPDFLLGLDLAGDEGTSNPDELAIHFRPAHERCMRITIHAGEGEPAANIWEAAYLLNADRIGHGLTLPARPDLMARFRDRGTCVEVCPTSNREVVGFYDPSFPTADPVMPLHPLGDFLDFGTPICICTDNPGISRVELSDEYLTAARMAPGGISLWETLSLMRQGFQYAFAALPARQQALTEAEGRLFSVVNSASFPASPTA